MANYYSTTLQKGSKGDEVKNWQQYLNTQGYNLAVDGDFGDKTYNATLEYQTANGLVADGIVGDKTYGNAGFVKLNSTPTAAPNVGSAPTGPAFNTTATERPTIDPAPDTPTFNTTATERPTIDPAPDSPMFNTTVTEKPTTDPLPDAPVYDTTNWDDTDKGQAALGNYNTAKDAVNNYEDFTYEDYVMGEDAQAAKDALNTHNANKPGEYQSQWQNQLDSLMNQIMNRDKFSYNMNEDALYQQSKDQYIQQGKMAMADTMGQAAAMTGGYGSSYAQSVGQQAYQGQLQNLNDIVPELYQMALDRYNQEGQDLYNQYGLVMDRENTDYGRYRDSVSDWNNDRNYLQSVYNDERSFDYGKYTDDRSFAYTLHQDGYQRLLDALGIAKSDYYDGANLFHTEQDTKNSVASQEFNDAMNLWTADTDNKWREYEADEDARKYGNSILQQGYENDFNKWTADSDNAWREYEADEDARKYGNSILQQGYENDFNKWEADSNNAWREAEWDEAARQDANEEAWRQKEWDENNRRYEESKVTSGESGSNGNNGGNGSNYDNGGLSDAQIKELQKAVGAGQDGKWGPKSTEAAGGLTAKEAWEAYQAGKLGKKEPDTITPSESENTTSFINSHMTAEEFMQRGGTSKTPSLRGGGGRSYAEYKEYIVAELEKNWGMMSDEEKAYLIEYYKL